MSPLERLELHLALDAIFFEREFHARRQLAGCVNRYRHRLRALSHADEDVVTVRGSCGGAPCPRSHDEDVWW